eukprot:CAMPEP_0114265770 /NCGR_PEP_ID=MMETSP0058-20121206/24152_1 /TAXON_ID=36894 /ORGANISM="Pyramimonas parkeae, CCMP726" /LENGTH=955 /DNA_ID=CAMNT_0001383003 /DNA_START=387 /DNA_END=3254 /DNA_ORIENTATION=-
MVGQLKATPEQVPEMDELSAEGEDLAPLVPKKTPRPLKSLPRACQGPEANAQLKPRGMARTMRRTNSTSRLQEIRKKRNPLKSIFRPFDEEYSLGDTLGTGGYAVVRVGTKLATGEKFAVKIMKIGKAVLDDQSDEAEADDEDADEDEDEPDELTFEQIIDNEIGLVSKLDHPNIIKIKEYFINFSKCYIVMDLLEGPVLLDALLEMGKYTEKDAKTIMERLFDAVSYMHLANVTHRDLKLENLVLKRPGDLSSVVIVDFGFAKAARARDKMVDVVGTPWYSAPELLVADPYTSAVDLWALGVGLYMLLIGEFPFDDPEEEVMEDAIIAGDYIKDGPKWSAISPEANDLVQGLLSVDPKQRPTAAEALEHSWFTGLKQHSSSTLVHAHTRLRELAACTRLPTKTFQPGQFLIRQGERGRGKAVYMIMSGECEVLLRREGVGEMDQRTPGGEHIKVGTRRVGNFIGDLGVSTSFWVLRNHYRVGTPRSSYHYSQPNTPGKGALDPARAGSSPPLMVSLPIDIGGPTAREPAAQSAALHKWYVLLTVMLAARHWFGKRRKASVRAVLPVTVCVLDQTDMQWAVEHDYRLSTELQDAMKRQRKALRQSLKREQKSQAEQASREASGEGGASVGVGSQDSPTTPVRLENLRVPVAAAAGRMTRTTSGERDPVKKFKAGVDAILREYFQSTDIGEVAAQIAELDAVCGSNKMQYFVKRAVCAALDQSKRECELVAVLINALSPALLSTDHLNDGLLMLLEAAEDLSLDIPHAPDQLMMFLARAVVDEIVSPSDIESIKREVAATSVGAQVATAAMNLVRARHSTERILMAWGGGAAGTVEHFKESMAAILQEFRSTQSVPEAAQYLNSLKVPHYHHEFVKKALTMGVENPGMEAAMLELLDEMNNMGLVTDGQMQMGFARMAEYVEDLELDVPGAQERFKQFQDTAAKAGIPTSIELEIV